MIKIIEAPEQLNFLGETPFGCKIAAAASAYGLDEPFAMFWVQDNSRAVLAKVDDSLLLEDLGAEYGEIAEFIRMLDVKRISCSESAAQKLGLAANSCGEIMVCKSGVKLECSFEVEINPGLRSIYELLCECQTENFVPPEFEPFYMDMSYRTRHGAALSVGIRHGGKLVSCALCSSVTRNSAVISAVACAPEFRRKGFGKAAVSALIAQLNRKNIYIFRADGENEEFYRFLNFTPYSRYADTVY